MTTTNPVSALIRDRENPAGVLRFGVFFDGGWFSGLRRYLDEASHWRSAPTFLGVHDAIRWFLPVRFTGIPRPAPCRKYPQMRSVQLYQPHGLIT